MYKTIQARHGMLQSGLQKVLDVQYEKGWEYIGSHGDELIFKRIEKPVFDDFMNVIDVEERFRELFGPP